MAEQADIRVAIADDEEGMRLILRKLIEGEEGFSLCGEAKDGQELLALAAEKRPQVCILDVEMPGMSGLECARLLQDTDPQTVLVFATAHEGYMAEAFEVYAFDYWVKPFKLDRAKQTLGRIRQAQFKDRKNLRRCRTIISVNYSKCLVFRPVKTFFTKTKAGKARVFHRLTALIIYTLK